MVDRENQKLAKRTTPDSLLWKYYLCHASKTIVATSTDPGHTRMWQESIPAIAFTNPMASHAMMAFSAFCLSVSAPTESQAYHVRATAELHYYQSLIRLRNSLPSVDLSSADAVLASAMILIPCGLALAQSDKGVYSLNDWLCHLRGWRAIGSRIYGSNGRMRSITQLIPYPQPGIPDPDDLPQGHHGVSRLQTSANVLMSQIQASWRKAMSELSFTINERSSGHDASDSKAYLASVTALEYILDYVSEFPVANLFRAVFIWPIQISPRYIELLSSYDDLALAIYAHWLVLTMAVDALWWVKGFGPGQIERLAGQSKFSNLPGSELLRWPIEMLQVWRSGTDSIVADQTPVR